MPVLVTVEGRPLTGDEIFQYLQTLHTSPGTACVYPPGELEDQVKIFYNKLEEVNIGVLTHGLAFQPNQTKLLRFPYCKQQFFEKVRAALCRVIQ